jgi:hypothetical protein
VTAAPDHGRMSRRTERTGIFVVRAWFEGDEPEDFRARITYSLDVTSGEEVMTTTYKPDDVSRHLELWLEALATDAGDHTA